MLEEYSNKRNFSRTPEPVPQPQNKKGPLIFVVHKHAARRLHYDLRLEVDGVLKSWAVPGGPSLNPAVKRLAVLVEDHPLEYRTFEGIIPAGEYGAGQVIIWDQGVYLPEEEGRPFNGANSRAQDLMLEGLQKGKLSFTLYSSKLKGSWTLVKMQRTKNDWLLIKHQDEYANSEIDILQQDESVLSGLTIQDLKAGRSPDDAAVNEKVKIPGSLQALFPTSIRPMLASLIKKPFSDPQWVFEPKLDGYRTLAFIQNGEVNLISRNGLNVSRKYLNLVEDLKKLPAREIVLDGELVAIDATGRLCFQCLQDFANPQIRHLHAVDTPHAIVYYVFDILYFNGYDLSNAPLYRRKELLKKILLPSERIRLVEYFENDGISLFEAAIKNGLEGVIGKLKESIYEPGRRSQSWLKIKASQSDEFIVGGYTTGEGNRADTFGSLLLGNYYSEGQLIFVGHVGTGFDDTTLAELKQRFTALKTTKCPFSTTPPANGPVTWVKPELVAEVKFAEKTQDGYLRAPVFLRLRDDKSPNEVTVNEPLPDSPENRPESPSPSKDENGTDILEQLANRRNGFDLNVGENKISLSNLDKALWPSSGASAAVTKRDLLIYLTRVSPYLLPHLKDRPLTLTRYPNGVNSEHFYQKHITDALPSFVQTAALTESVSGTQDYLVCNNLATLLWLGQLANIDLHTWFSSITPGSIPLGSDQSNDKTPDFYSHYPDFVVFDIDPYVYSGRESAGAEPELNPRAFEQTCKVALWLKEVLNNLTLNSYLKTSGKTGLHIYVPLIRQLGFPEVHAAAKTIASFLLQNHPQEITIDWSVSARTGKVFVDYNQNVRGKTLASVYSPRPASRATVSTPLLWSELGHIYPTDFTVLNVPERLAKLGDIWVDILDKRGNLVKVLNIKE